MPYESRIPQIVVQMQERLKAAEKEAARRVAAKARERAPRARHARRHAATLRPQVDGSG